MQEALSAYIERKGITVSIVTDQGIQRDKGKEQGRSWERHAYILRLSCADTGESMEVPWSQGLGITESPEDTPGAVLSALLSDSEALEYDFEEWASNYGLDADSRSAERTYQECRRLGSDLRFVLGGEEAWQHALYEVERD